MSARPAPQYTPPVSTVIPLEARDDEGNGPEHYPFNSRI